MNRVNLFQLLDGWQIASPIIDSLERRAALLKRSPCLGVFFSKDPTSAPFEYSLQKVCKQVGVQTRCEIYDEESTAERIESVVSRWNRDENVDGVICIPSKFNPMIASCVRSKVSPVKNVEFATEAISCRAFATLELLKFSSIELKDKSIVYYGLPNRLSKDVFSVFMQKKEGSSFSLVTPSSGQIANITRKAHILIVNTGFVDSLDRSMLGAESVVVDLGFNGNNCGDVNLIKIIEKVSHFGSMQRGVWPITAARMLSNLFDATALK